MESIPRIRRPKDVHTTDHDELLLATPPGYLPRAIAGMQALS